MNIDQNLLDFIPADKTDRAKLAAEITDEVVAQLPEEKARLGRELAQTAIETETRQSHYVEGLGQEFCSIPPIAYLRWHQLLPGCWKDKSFRDEFLIDNPACCLNGYRPKAKTVYFDMAARPGATPTGAQLYRALKKQIGLPDGLRPHKGPLV